MDEDVRVIDIVFPKDTTNVKLPDPELVNYYRDYEDRKIYIDFDIEDSTFEITKQILEYNRQDLGKKIEDRKPITVYIMSYGGDLYQAYALIGTMLSSVTPIYTVNMGVAMSAGLLILLAGHRRYAMRYSTAMIHSGSGGAQGTYEQMEEQQKNYKKLIEQMRAYILERTKMDSKLFSKQKSKEWYITDKEQVELGIVDKVVDNIVEVL